MLFYISEVLPDVTNKLINCRHVSRVLLIKFGYSTHVFSSKRHIFLEFWRSNKLEISEHATKLALPPLKYFNI